MLAAPFADPLFVPYQENSVRKSNGGFEITPKKRGEAMRRENPLETALGISGKRLLVKGILIVPLHCKSSGRK